MYIQFPLDEFDHYVGILSRHAWIVARWAEGNHLKLNVSKTKAIVFDSNFYINKQTEMPLKGINLDHTTIKFETSVRNLGVWFDARLNWQTHVISICKRANSFLYRLNFFRKSTNLKFRKHLIKTLLFLLVDCCYFVYCDLSVELNFKLQRVVNSGITYIYGVKISDHISPYRHSLGWLTVCGRRNFFAVSLLYKIFKTDIPSYLRSHCLLNQPLKAQRG